MFWGEQGSEELLNTFPTEVREAIKVVNSKDPINLRSPESNMYFVNQQEKQDVVDLLRLARQPIVMALTGSRLDRVRPFLFGSIEDFEFYHEAVRKSLQYDTLSYWKYMGISPQELQTVRELLDGGQFNARYLRGEKFPANLAEVLVSDIDFTVISASDRLKSGVYTGRRTNVPIDVTALYFQNRDQFFTNEVATDDYAASLRKARPVVLK